MEYANGWTGVNVKLSETGSKTKYVITRYNFPPLDPIADTSNADRLTILQVNSVPDTPV